MASTLYTTPQAAQKLGLQPATLHKWRWLGKGPKHLKLGRAIRYTDEQIEEFIAECERSNTSEGAA